MSGGKDSLVQDPLQGALPRLGSEASRELPLGQVRMAGQVGNGEALVEVVHDPVGELGETVCRGSCRWLDVLGLATCQSTSLPSAPAWEQPARYGVTCGERST